MVHSGIQRFENDAVHNHNRAPVLERAENSRDQCMIGSRFSSSQCEGFKEYPVPMSNWSPSVVHFPWGANTSCQNLQSVPGSHTPTRAAAQEESALQGWAKKAFLLLLSSQTHSHLEPDPQKMAIELWDCFQIRICITKKEEKPWNQNIF